jgi:hypothetical protein
MFKQRKLMAELQQSLYNLYPLPIRQMAYYNIQLRRGTTADWTANENNVLNA